MYSFVYNDAIPLSRMVIFKVQNIENQNIYKIYKIHVLEKFFNLYMSLRKNFSFEFAEI